MKKRTTTIIAICVCSLHVSAQFTGSYSLKDDGVDVPNCKRPKGKVCDEKYGR
jgi:hypothetical protein